MPSQWGSFNNASDQNGSATDERVASLFQPDTLLSAQYFDNLRRKTYFEPEKRLMLAMLQDAINTYRDKFHAQSRKGKRLFAETESWVVESNGDWIFSFNNVCEALSLNPEYVRQGLVRWKEKLRHTPPRHEAPEKKRAAG
jgi:hypothetical protein